MGQKIHPIGFRMGISATWKSRWFAKGVKYKQNVLEDIKIRDILMKKLRPAGIQAVEIESLQKQVLASNLAIAIDKRF